MPSSYCPAVMLEYSLYKQCVLVPRSQGVAEMFCKGRVSSSFCLGCLVVTVNMVESRRFWAMNPGHEYGYLDYVHWSLWSLGRLWRPVHCEWCHSLAGTLGYVAKEGELNASKHSSNPSASWLWMSCGHPLQASLIWLPYHDGLSLDLWVRINPFTLGLLLPECFMTATGKNKQKTSAAVHTLQEALPLGSSWYLRIPITSEACFLQPFCVNCNSF